MFCRDTGIAGHCTGGLILPIEVLDAGGRRQVGELQCSRTFVGQRQGQLRKRGTPIPLCRLGADYPRAEVQRSGRDHDRRLRHRKQRIGADGKVLCSAIAGDGEDGRFSAGEAGSRGVIDLHGAARVCRDGGADRAVSSRAEAEVGCAGGVRDGSDRQRRATDV